MWPWKPRNIGGSLTLEERYVRALEESNALLRAQLSQAGVKVLPQRPIRSETPPTKRTASDVTVMTRESLIESQERDREQQRLAETL